MKILKSALFWLIVCCIPLLFISSNLRWGMTELSLYEYGIDTYPVSAVTGITKPELLKVHQHLIDYYNSKIDTAQVAVQHGEKTINIFNEKELIHLRDVKGLFLLDCTVQIVTFSIVLACILLLLFLLKEKWRISIKGILWGSAVTLGLVLFLALWSLVGFEQLFVFFHQLSFTNQFWILDPSKDYLIMLFPSEFFYDVALFGFGAVVLQSAVLGGIAWGLLKIRRT
jgi:integral membrane protein (TIGR01906 family)